MKRILVPTDFSKQAEFAAETAARIAKHTGARVFLLHAIDVPHLSGVEPGERSNNSEAMNLMNFARLGFQKLVAKPFFKDVDVAEIIQWDNTFSTIAKEGEKHDMDLIVMGSKGAFGAEDFLIGSNTEKVIRSSDIPVLTVKDVPGEMDWSDIVFASNFYGESSDNFHSIKSIAEVFGSKIHLLKVITQGNFEPTHISNRLIEEFVAETGVSNYTVNIINAEDVEEGVFWFSDNVNADVIAIETHGRSGFLKLFRKSVSEDIANHSERPVLTVRIKDISHQGPGIFPS